MAKRKILIVDDEERNIKLLQAMLRSENYELITCLSGEKALEEVNRAFPDLILMDVMMPGIDGFEACRRLKAGENTRVVPVVMVTALREKEHRLKAMEVGADDFLSKPVDQTELLIRVKSLLRIKSYHDDLMNSYKEITEKNERLEELEKVKEGLTHMIIHDLNNPLLGIYGSVQLVLADEEACSEGVLKRMKKCLHYCKDLKQQVQGLLDIHKMEEAGLTPVKTTTDMNDLMESVLMEFNERAEGKQISVSFDKNSDAPAVELDPDIMKRVLANLLGNAVRHTPEKGTIECKVDFLPEKEKLSLCIKDSGEGVAPEYHQKIFNKFEQVRLKKSGVSVGTGGLGLAFCKMATEAHQGKIWVESRGDGDGCAFHIELPLNAPG